MKAVCPSCDSPFEVDDALASGPGLPLCNACSSAVGAPPPPPVPAAPGPSEAPPSSEAPPISSSELVPVVAAPVQKRKPSFFSVESDPPPPPSAPPASLPRGPDSAHEDLRKLMAVHGDDDRKSNSELYILRGGLFGEAARPAAVPPDLSLLVDVDFEEPPKPAADVAPPPPRSGPVLAPVLALDRLSEHPPAAAHEAGDGPDSAAFEVGKGASQRPARPAPRRESEAQLRPSKSGAPGPVVSERRAAAAKRNGLASWAVVGAVGSVSAVVILVALRLGGDSKPDPAPSESATTTATTPAEMAALPAPSGTAKAAPTAEVSAEPAPTAARTAEPARDRPAAERREVAQPVGARTAEPARPVEPARTVAERVAPPPVVTAPPPAAAGGDFDRGAARAALAAAAGAAAGCKQGDDPSGGARVSVTFAPSGRVSSARVVGPPFQGTKTGACIAAAFRSASVPPFGGDPVAVTKEVVVR